MISTSAAVEIGPSL